MTYKKPRHCSAGAFLILEFETHNQLRFYGLSITPHSKNNKKFFLIQNAVKPLTLVMGI